MPTVEQSAFTTDQIQIVAERNDGKKTTHVLVAGESILVGSDDQCRLRLPDPSVSSKHCLVRFQNGEISLQDWCSQSGTQLNGEAIDGEATVSPADLVQLGNHQLVFRSHSDSRQNKLDLQSCAAPEEERDATEKDDSPSVSAQPAPPSGKMHGARHDLRTTPREEVVSRPTVVSVSVEADTIELLKSELELLQTELSQKDAQLAELLEASHPAVDQAAGVCSEELESRIERLLYELDQSDQRISALEEVSRLAEETSLAEAEEKRQLEAWVHDIEQRIAEREEESRAECDVLRRRLEQATEERALLDERIEKLLQGGGGDPALEEMVQVLRNDNESLNERLAGREAECLELKKRCAGLQQQTSEDFIRQRIDESLRAERLQLAQERATLSRQQLELTNKVHELKHEMERQSRVHPADDKFQAFREQLKELHQQEQKEYVPPTISQRLARLWQRLDGPTDRD